MNVFVCSGKYFDEKKDRIVLLNQARGELNGTFYYSPSENILTTARMKMFDTSEIENDSRATLV